MKVLMSFEKLSIIDRDAKRHLEDYLDARCFSQRKSYDEYYIDVQNAEFDNLGSRDLMYLAQRFKVEVCEDIIYLDSK